MTFIINLLIFLAIIAFLDLVVRPLILLAIGRRDLLAHNRQFHCTCGQKVNR